MKILHVIQRYPPAIGGSEQWAAGLARRQARAGHEVEVCTLAVDTEDEYFAAPLEGQRRILPGVEQMEGVTVRRFEPTRMNPFRIRRTGNRILSNPAFDSLFERFTSGPHSLPLYAALPGRARWADIMHLHAVPFPHNRAGYLAARLLRKPVAITPHFHPGHAAFERRGTLSLLKDCDAVFTVSAWESAYLAAKGVALEKLHVTCNAIDTRPYERGGSQEKKDALRERLRIPKDAPIAAYIGRKIPQKGLRILFDAAPSFLEHHPEARLVLAGPESDWLTGIHGTLPAHVRARIVDAGELTEEDKIALLHTSRFLVLPGESEAFGIVFLEAWACGIPVVGASTGAIPHVIEDGGLTYLAGNAADLAAKMSCLLEEEDLARRLANRGADYVHHRYTWEKILGVVEEVYGSLGKA